jgi:hypothetical protein
MSTKEDILEQIVEEYLTHKGYFVRHNVKFKPRCDHPDFMSKLDSNHSDIDVLGYNPHSVGAERVYAVSCKSWQTGFDTRGWVKAIQQNKTVSGRKAWQKFRELCQPKWSEAFVQAIEGATGCRKFTYVVAVASVRPRSTKSDWEAHEPFLKAIEGNPIRILTFREMISDILPELKHTLAATEVGRMLQMFRAAGYTLDDLPAALGPSQSRSSRRQGDLPEGAQSASAGHDHMVPE